VVEGEVGHLFPAPTSQHNASPVIFVVPTTNNYLSYLGKKVANVLKRGIRSYAIVADP
jgi:hypothetical protein